MELRLYMIERAFAGSVNFFVQLICGTLLKPQPFTARIIVERKGKEVNEEPEFTGWELLLSYLLITPLPLLVDKILYANSASYLNHYQQNLQSFKFRTGSLSNFIHIMESVQIAASDTTGMGNNSGMNMPLTQQQNAQPSQSKYVKIWEGTLTGQKQGQLVFICLLECYRSASASDTLAADWPSTIKIVRLIAQEHMNNKQYVGRADFLVFQTLNQHGFLGHLQEKKLCAVIQLPSQTLLLSVSDNAGRLIGMLFPGDMVGFKTQVSSQQQQQMQQQQLQPLLMQQQKETGGGEEIGVTIDPDLLDCSICFDPLCPPLYQCMNGHVACPSCWSKLKEKCHICTLPVLSRNIALEKVLESVHLPCMYSHFGCRKSVSYSQRQVHADTCEFGPSSCAIPGCTHKAFSGEWLGHFLEDHRFSCCHFIYGESCTIKFNQGDPYFTLFGPDKNLFLLVNEPVLNIGSALSLYRINQPHLCQNVMSYELTVGTDSGMNTNSVQLKSQVGLIKEWKNEVCGSFLFVPLVLSASGQIEGHVLIKKLDVTSLE